MAPTPDTHTLIDQAHRGDRRALGRLISLVEDRRPGAEEVLAHLYQDAGRAWTTGLTGAPGSGKSTLTDRLIEAVRGQDSEVAVLAVDPSSPFTGGAILGDRVRMQRHIDDHGVYIRSMASRGQLGGIAEATPRAIVVLDGIGFPEILVETVGIGQAEVEVAAATHTTVVVLNPGWGDSIQAAKAGLLEVGNIFVVNKADRPGVNDTIRDLKQMLELGDHGDWWPPVITTVATTGEGVAEAAGAITDHRVHLEQSGRLENLRRDHAIGLLEEAVDAELRRRLHAGREGVRWGRVRDDVAARRLDPWTAARRLVDPEA